MKPNGSNARQNTAATLVAQGWAEDASEAWAHHTADSPAQIQAWRDAKYTPKQAQSIYALSNDVDPTDWRDLGLDPDTTAAYVEAGFAYAEAADMENRDARPDSQTMAVMKALRLEGNQQAVKDFNAALRADSEVADLDDNWSF